MLTNSFLEVYLFSNSKKEDNFEINFINGAKILMRQIGNESQILELKERIKGKYEIIAEPGDYIINVLINGKEVSNKDINLNSGLNKINIEL